MIQAEILEGFGILLGGIGAGAMAVKKWPFFKKNGNSKAACPMTGCHDIVITTSAKVKTLEEGQNALFERVNALPGEIVRLLKDTKGLLK